MDVVGRQERPRLLAVGIENEADREALSKCVPTFRFLSRDQELANVRQGDYDVAILMDCDPPLDDHLFVIQFGGPGGRPNQRTALLVNSITKSIEFKIPDGLPGSIDKLVRSCLVAEVQASDYVEITGFRRYVGPGWGAADMATAEYEPFLLDGDDKPVAGALPRGQARWWRLPSCAENPAAWLVAAIEVWRRWSPLAFPSADWISDPRWMTSSEKALEGQIERLTSERDDAVSQFDARISQAREALDAARAAADSDERLLLTAQGEELVAAVQKVAEELGFAVVDVDAEITERGARLEDLRVSLPGGDAEWTAIVEVRGYSRGAKVGDLARLARFESRFTQEHDGRRPDASWYVVNQQIGHNPASRQVPLQSNPEDVSEFGLDSNGLVIDTRQLFSLVMKVREGELSSADARSLLQSQTGWLDLN